MSWRRNRLCLPKAIWSPLHFSVGLNEPGTEDGKCTWGASRHFRGFSSGYSLQFCNHESHERFKSYIFNLTFDKILVIQPATLIDRANLLLVCKLDKRNDGTYTALCIQDSSAWLLFVSSSLYHNKQIKAKLHFQATVIHWEQLKSRSKLTDWNSSQVTWMEAVLRHKLLIQGKAGLVVTVANPIRISNRGQLWAISAT